jgi:hypothetical protein
MAVAGMAVAGMAVEAIADNRRTRASAYQRQIESLGENSGLRTCSVATEPDRVLPGPLSPDRIRGAHLPADDEMF